MKLCNRLTLKRTVSLLSAAALTAWSANTFAGGFQLFEQNAVNMGDFGAGGAAIATDASTAYFDPAGLVRIPTQVVISADGVFTKHQFTGTTRWQSLVLPAPFNSFTQTGTAQGGTSNVVPAFHFATPISNRFFFGFSAAVPFGLSTQYGDASIMRYTATKSEIEVFDLSPALAFAVDNHLSVGGGLDVLHVDATLEGTTGFPAGFLAPTLSPTAFDTKSQNTANAWGYGWHAGVLYQFTPATRVGIAYQSKSSFHLTGHSRLSGPLATGGPLSSNNLTADLTLPPTTTLSAYHDLNSQWAIDGSVYYTQWSRFTDVLVLQNIQGGTAAARSQFALPSFFQNSWRFSGGVLYTVNSSWKIRAGGGVDQTPVQNRFRSVRLPDATRIGSSIGAHYQASKNLGFDAGWTHLFVRDAGVSLPVVTNVQTSTPSGSFNSSAELVGIQLNWNI